MISYEKFMNHFFRELDLGAAGVTLGVLRLQGG